MERTIVLAYILNTVLSGNLVFLFIGPDYEISKLFEHIIKFIFLSISLICVLGYQKNRLNEKVLLSTHNICFG